MKSEHFELEEFMCRDGTPYPKEWIQDRLEPLVACLEKIRTKFDSPIYITSAYRTKEYNQKMSGAKHSLHCEGLAVDFKVANIGSELVYRMVDRMINKEEIPDGGLGLYPTWVHYDLRGIIGMEPARWNKKYAVQEQVTS